MLNPRYDAVILFLYHIKFIPCCNPCPVAAYTNERVHHSGLANASFQSQWHWSLFANP